MTAAFTLWSKHMAKYRSSPEEMFGMLIQPILWVVLFGVGMKSLLEPSTSAGSDSYVTFMLPGIIALSALGGAVAGGMVWLDERLRGVVKEYVAAPIARSSILLGNALSVTTKAVIQSVVILLVGVLIGASVGGGVLDWLGAFVLLATFGLGFAGVALSLASSIDNQGGYHAVIMLLNLPLLFLSDALYPLDALPTWMAIGARLNPTSYLVDGLRHTILPSSSVFTGSAILPLWSCYAVTAGFAVFGVWLASLAFRRSLR